MRKTVIILSLAAICLGLLPHSEAKENTKKPDGKQIFAENCASCHKGGDNSQNANRPVVGSSKLETLEKFKKYLNAPREHMPFYPNIVNNRKTVEALYRYCKSLPKLPVKQALRPGTKESTQRQPG